MITIRIQPFVLKSKKVMHIIETYSTPLLSQLLIISRHSSKGEMKEMSQSKLLHAYSIHLAFLTPFTYISLTYYYASQKLNQLSLPTYMD